MGHPVNWFQIQGQDAKGLQGFYKKVFAWKMQPSPDGSPMAMVSREQGGIDGGIGASMDGQKNVTVYVGVSDIRGHLAKIEKAGGKTAMPPMELPQGMGFIAGFSDPAGNWVGLWQPGKAVAAAKSNGATKAKKAAPKRKAKAKARAAAKKPAKKAAKKAAKKPAKKGKAKRR
jgi:uncharacterized protein